MHLVIYSSHSVTVFPPAGQNGLSVPIDLIVVLPLDCKICSYFLVPLFEKLSHRFRQLNLKTFASYYNTAIFN